MVMVVVVIMIVTMIMMMMMMMRRRRRRRRRRGRKEDDRFMLHNTESNGLLSATKEGYRRGGKKGFYKDGTNSKFWM